MRVNPEEKKRIWKERARALAQRAKENDADDFVEVLAFSLAHETYAIELAHIREVLPLKQLTPLPGVPSFVLGVIHLRGEIISVIDLKVFFQLPVKGLTDLNRVIVLESRHMTFALLADLIVGVRRLSRGRIQPSLPTLGGIQAEYLKGVTEDGIVVLDAEKVLADEKIVVQ